ncbi:ParB N-terminal domain-containing protein [Actinocorallia longicatena]|uniref:ParB N-terminal domain-containing protein n=1 Tax=Actinocorallia longicatena TaxID=111803 RepID=A0ABP6QUL9_9ACTN
MEESAGLLAAMAASERLRCRRFELLPLRGEGAVFTDVQGRGPGESTAPSALADLISSISEIGLLQPVLVEVYVGRHHLVAGERRLRAMRWGATAAPGNPHFAALPAVVCDGPLTEEERRRWQLVENLARERLQPRELAAALLYERSAILAERLAGAGIEVPPEVMAEPDAVTRFASLERVRGHNAGVAAPWSDVLRRTGVQMSSRKARAVVAAFRALPRELSEEMDAHQVALTTRLSYLRLAGGRSHAAEEIWSAVRERGRTDLLSAAVQAAIEDPERTVEETLGAAEDVHQAANASRAAKLSAEPALTSGVESALVRRTLGALRELSTQLAAGAQIDGYAAGSLRLLVAELHGRFEKLP